MAGDGKSVMDEFAEFLEARAAASQEKDFAVNLRNAAGDEVTGIPISQAAGWLEQKFGIGAKPKKGAGDGSSGEGQDGGEGAKGGPSPVIQFFQGKRAAGGQA